MVVELHHWPAEKSAAATAALSRFADLRAMVCESVGAVRHEVSVPFHDSQVRGVALLIETGWDQYWGTDAYNRPGPYLSEHLIFRMVRSGVAIAAVDFPVITGSTETRLIRTGKLPIVENLRSLGTLPRVGFRFSVVPLADEVDGIRAVRAFAQVTR